MEQVTLSAERIAGVFTRKLPGGGQQALVCTEQGIHPLLGVEGASLLDGSRPSVYLGAPLPITERTPDGRIAPYTWPAAGDGAARAPLYAISDPGAVGDGNLCFLSTRDAILRLDAAGLMEVVAGQPGCPGHRDGPGSLAQVQSALVMTADGTGGLFFSDGSRDSVRRARLAPLVRPATAAPAQAVAVATLPFQIPEWSLVHAMSYDHSAGVLYVCTPRLIYRAVGVGGAAGTAPPGLYPVAGGEEGSGSGFADGAGRGALFGSLCDAVVDSRGCLYVVDMEGPDGAVVRRVDPSAGWAVQTLSSCSLGELDRAARLAILPGGWLCVYEWGGNKLWMTQLGLEPSRPLLPAAAAAPPPAPAAVPAAVPAADPCLSGLAEDFGAMLADPWHTADVVVMVAGGAFPAHSQILIARCEYFRRRLLQGGRQQGHPAAAAAAAGDATGVVSAAAVGGRRELSLPDANADAFAQLLRYIYTGATDFPEPLLRPVLELANRLVLPRVVTRLQQQLQLRQQHPQQLAAAAYAPAGAAAPPGPAAAAAAWAAGAGPGATGAPGEAASQAASEDDDAPSAPPADPGPFQLPQQPPPLTQQQLQPQQPQQLQPQHQQLQPQHQQQQLQPQQQQQQQHQHQQQQLQPQQQLQLQQPQQQQQAPQSSQPTQAQPQPYPSYPYPHRPGYGEAAPPPAFGPSPGGYGAQPQGYAPPPAQLYGGAPPPSAYGAPPLMPGYGAPQPPAFGAAQAPPQYGAPGPGYPPQPGMYGAAPPVGYGAPPPYPPQGYPSQMYGGAPPPPPQGGGYYR